MKTRMAMVNAAAAAAGGGSCGYTTSEMFCTAGSSSDMRVTCKSKWGGTPDCTLENCDGATIELTGLLSGCS